MTAASLRAGIIAATAPAAAGFLHECASSRTRQKAPRPNSRYTQAAAERTPNASGKLRSSQSIERQRALADEFQRAAEERLEVVTQPLLFGFPDCCVGGRSLTTQIHQCRQHVLLDYRERGGWCSSGSHRWGAARNHVELLLQLEHDPLGSLLSNAGDAHKRLHGASANGRNQLSSCQAGQYRDGELRSDSANRNQLLEDSLLISGAETEQCEGVLANMCVDA